MQALDINFNLETIQKPLPSSEQKVSSSETSFLAMVQNQQKTVDVSENTSEDYAVHEQVEVSYENKDTKPVEKSSEKKSLSVKEEASEENMISEDVQVNEEAIESLYSQYFSLNELLQSDAEVSESDSIQISFSQEDIPYEVKVSDSIISNEDQLKWLTEENVDFDSEMLSYEKIGDEENLSERVELSASYNVLPEKSSELSADKNIKKDNSFQPAEKNADRISSKKNSKSLKDVLTVKDLRSENEKSKVKQVSDKKDFLTQVKAEGNKAEYSVQLSNQADRNILSLDGQSAGAVDSTYQAMLTNELQENAGEIVKAGTVVLKDNRNGTINLILHPESLGNVKITLELSDKVLTGHVTVSSREAYNAFQESIAALRDSFIESGFDTANFDISYSSQESFAQSGNDDGSNSRQKGRNIYGDFVSENSSVNSNLTDTFNDSEDFSINIVA